MCGDKLAWCLLSRFFYWSKKVWWVITSVMKSPIERHAFVAVGGGGEGVIVVVVVKSSVVRCLFNRNCKLQFPVKLWTHHLADPLCTVFWHFLHLFAIKAYPCPTKKSLSWSSENLELIVTIAGHLWCWYFFGFPPQSFAFKWYSVYFGTILIFWLFCRFLIFLTICGRAVEGNYATDHLSVKIIQIILVFSAIISIFIAFIAIISILIASSIIRISNATAQITFYVTIFNVGLEKPTIKTIFHEKVS